MTLGQAVSGYAASLPNIDIPVVMAPFVNMCNGDAFAASGTFHLVMHETTTPGGGFHMDSMDNTSNLKSDMPAEPSGSDYSVSITDTLVTNLDTSGITEGGATDHVIMISHGPAPNFMTHITFHMTLHPDGAITGFVDKVTFSC
ncbi:MAG: hypothetical protein E6J08_04745 [Chloroflexi bacterium]|nr:MAG: hypothetical protein E6J08_04745 [Chloroflexota bacterium]